MAVGCAVTSVRSLGVWWLIVRVRRLSDQEGQKLQQIVLRGSTSTVRFRRAMMLLASAGGNRVPVIAKLVQADEDTVRDVIHRFNEIGLACLDPRWAGGRPRLLSLAWATEAFRLTTGGVRPDTQIHTHMCYAEFGDIVQAIDDLDADVISLEAARSRMQVARELAAHGYPREAGPGVYDIHSPRVPDSDEVAALLRTGLKTIPAERLWVNPDCGLKTRGWPETRASLENLVAAARTVRTELSAS
ncbi:helix-turn-helix domain-containing protein [Streptomyces sp. NPDC015532]|uniref:helix-turn-helix domain-containing protein n=1 Tax=Streptomyces sp. NPDC015532 TaxID=3364960 RepID=UPI0036F8623F